MEAPVKGDGPLGPQLAHNLDLLGEHRRAMVEVGAERQVLRSVPAGSHRKPKAPLASAVDLREFNDLMHNMDRLRAHLHRLGINLPEAQPGSDGADQMHEHLRHLAVLADVGDHRRARDMWRPEEP